MGVDGRPSRLPVDREERRRLLEEDSLEYVRRMGRSELVQLMVSLARTNGLSVEEEIELWDELHGDGG